MEKFKVLIVYPNLSMMLTPSCAVGIFTKILKNKGYIVELFDCTPYDSNLEFLSEPLPVTRAYPNSKEILELVKSLPLYSKLPLNRYSEIKQAEIESSPDGPIFSKLKEEWYELAYGSNEEDRNLTYQG